VEAERCAGSASGVLGALAVLEGRDGGESVERGAGSLSAGIEVRVLELLK